MHPASKQGAIRGLVYGLILGFVLPHLLDLNELSWGKSILIGIVAGVVLALLLEPIFRKIYPYRRRPPHSNSDGG